MTNTSEIKITGDRIVMPSGFSISFQRTLRIPDDGKTYPLPPGLGEFPLRRVDDYADRVPAEWKTRGGVFLPMYQREAMWLRFLGERWKPRAVKVAVGKVCAISGAPWSEGLVDGRGKQDYMVAPPQPWLDGIKVSAGTIRQFVAMPLGMGYTVEGQVTGEETFGGLQIKVFEPKPGLFAQPPPSPAMCRSAAPCKRQRSGSMGLAAGGQMKQKIYPDPHGIDTWDRENSHRLFVHIVNSEMWREITGEAPPPSPITAKTYAQRRLPWFDLYDEHVETDGASATLQGVKSVKDKDVETFGTTLQDDESVDTNRVKKLLLQMAKGIGVRDGQW